MAANVLLLADDPSFADLRAHGRLGPEVMRSASPAAPHQLLDLLRDNGRIVRCPPSWLLAAADPTKDPFDGQDRAQIFNSLLDGTICYLAILEPNSPLEYHIEWYSRFLAQMKEQTRERHVHARHVLVLICTDPIPATAATAFARMTSAHGDEKLFDVAYVMLDELQPGAKDAFFYARHVWPIAVGRLLLKLLLDRPQQPAERTTAMAWRAYELAPQVDVHQRQTICTTQFALLHEMLSGDGSADERWNAAAFDPDNPHADEVKLSEPKDDGQAPSRWLEYEALWHLEDVKQERRWEAALTAAGAEFARRSDRILREQELPSKKEARKVWGSVRSAPRFIYSALGGRFFRPPNVAGQVQAVIKAWKGIRDKEHERQELIAAAEKNAIDFRLARDGFVGRWWRLAIVVCVSLFIGYMSMIVFYTALRSWGVAAAIAGAGALGSLLAAFLTWDGEIRAGRRGMEKLESALCEIDDSIRQRHELCQASVQQGQVFWQKIRAAAAASQLKLLLQRVRAMLEREIKYQPALHAPNDFHDDEDTASENGDAPNQVNERGQRQRRAFLRETLLQHPIEVSDRDDVDETNRLQHVARGFADDFRDDIWPAFCDRHDSVRAGHLPARRLVPLLREFHLRFLNASVAELHFLAIRRLRERELAEWGRRIHELVTHRHYLESMSLRVLGHQTTSSRYQPRLYLRPGVDYGAFHSGLGSTGSSMPEARADVALLAQLPMIGLLFQEVPVTFATNDKQVMAAAPVRVEATT